MQAKGVCQALVKVFSQIGVPHEILTNCGTFFTSSLVTQLQKTLGITRLLMSVYHPQADGLVGLLCKTIKAFPTLWDLYPDPLLFFL